jgi:hypothetical protein
LIIRNELLRGDLSTCLRLLQNYPNANVDDILESSRSLYLYETQITMVCQKGGVSLHEAMQALRPPPTIIMAYGLKGGVVPKLSERVEEAAQAAQETLNSKAGIIGAGLANRARGIWSKFGTASETKVEEVKPDDRKSEEVVEIPAKSPPPSSRIWKRSGSKGQEESMPTVPPIQVPTDNPSGNADTQSGFRSRLWNRGRSSSNDSAASKESAPEEAPDMGEAKNKDEQQSTPEPIKITLKEDTRIPSQSQKDILDILSS